MGGFVSFHCAHCGYVEDKIAHGHGRKTSPYLVLYRCDHCKTVGSTWTEGEKPPHCSGCYDENITLLKPVTGLVTCPRCEAAATLRVLDETWD